MVFLLSAVDIPLPVHGSNVVYILATADEWPLVNNRP
jgi:hypothetical protein